MESVNLKDYKIKRALEEHDKLVTFGKSNKYVHSLTDEERNEMNAIIMSNLQKTSDNKENN